MPDTPSITLVSRFPYRGQNEEFSNKYHFSGPTPADEAAWKALADEIWASQKTCVSGNVKLVKAYGYAAGNDHSVAAIDYVALGGALPQGNAAPASSWLMQGDGAVTFRAKRAGGSSKGKPVWCTKYLHGSWVGAGGQDSPHPDVKVALDAHAAKMTNGTLAQGRKWCAPQGQALSAPSGGVWTTTRTLRRRGKRPH